MKKYLLLIFLYCNTIPTKEIIQLEYEKENVKQIVQNSNIEKKQNVIEYIDKSFTITKNLQNDLIDCKNKLNECQKDQYFSILNHIKWFVIGIIIGFLLHSLIPFLLRRFII